MPLLAHPALRYTAAKARWGTWNNVNLSNPAGSGTGPDNAALIAETMTLTAAHAMSAIPDIRGSQNAITEIGKGSRNKQR